LYFFFLCGFRSSPCQLHSYHTNVVCVVCFCMYCCWYCLHVCFMCVWCVAAKWTITRNVKKLCGLMIVACSKNTWLFFKKQNDGSKKHFKMKTKPVIFYAETFTCRITIIILSQLIWSYFRLVGVIKMCFSKW
jgi:hypothetical protein